MTRADGALKAGVAGAIGMVVVKIGYVCLLFTCGFLHLDETASVAAVEALTLLLFASVSIATGAMVVWLSEGKRLAGDRGLRPLVKAGAIAGTAYAVLDAILAIPKAMMILPGEQSVYFGLGVMTRICIANPVISLLACIVIVVVSGLVFNAIRRGRRR